MALDTGRMAEKFSACGIGKIQSLIGIKGTDDLGMLAVIVVVLVKGFENKTLGAEMSRMPTKACEEHSYANASINAANMTSIGKDYYSFAGSLTIPTTAKA